MSSFFFFIAILAVIMMRQRSAKRAHPGWSPRELVEISVAVVLAFCSIAFAIWYTSRWYQ